MSIQIGFLTAPGLLLGEAGTAVTQTKTLLDYIKAGGLPGYVIVLLSFVAVALVITNLIQLRRTKTAPADIVREVDRLVAERNIPSLVAVCRAPENDSSLTRILGAALNRCLRSQFGMMELRSSIEEAGQRELERMVRNTDYIALIAAVAPMLGLLGTVIGMVGAFATIGELEGAARSHQLAIYMSMALAATAEGLVVAIPSTVAYALFKKRAERLASEVGEMMESWIGPIQQAEATAAPGAPRGARLSAPAPAIAPQPARGTRTA
jgi:biopolymer transport protein ExbB